jgi:hypothetical protein
VRLSVADMMDKQIRIELWEELKLLQPIIDKFDRFTFQIKTWFITIFSAITGYAIVNGKTNLVLINFGIALIFYAYEITYRMSHKDFLDRSREIEEFLRRNEDITIDCKPPCLGKYLFTDLESERHKNWFYNFQTKLHIDDKRAKRNVREWKFFFKEFGCCLIQPRVSLLYWTIAAVNLVVLLRFV